MGCFLVWRSLIKYLESLQQSPTFRSLRGALLEAWAYEEAIKLGFLAEKLILINKNKDHPTDKYKRMKDQISSFPKPPLELKIPFPEKYNRFYFQEFDLVIRVKNYIFVIECKGTCIPKGEWPKIFLWFEKLRQENLLLHRKINLLYELLQSRATQHPFLDGVEKVVQCHLKTEGILDKFITFSMGKFKEYLKILKNHLDEDKFDQFIKNYLIDFKKNS